MMTAYLTINTAAFTILRRLLYNDSYSFIYGHLRLTIDEPHSS